MDTLPICNAKSKQSGLPCKNYAIKGKSKCKFHGGYSTGAKTSEGKERQKMASWKHGHRSKEAIEENRLVKEYIKACKNAIRG